MEDKEMEEILHRLDERTEMMNHKIDSQNKRLDEQRERVEKAEDLAQDNRMILSGMTFGLGTMITALLGKIGGILN